MRLYAFSASLVVTTVIAGSLAACGSAEPAPAPEATVEQPPAQVEPASDPFELFGAALDPAVESVAFNLVLATPDAYAKKTIATSGSVRAACEKRGCWMEIRDPGDRASTGLTVRFKNYGFFVPLNSRGADVRIQGVVKVQKMTAAQVKEMEAEGGTVANKQPDGSATAIEFTATGVEMRGRAR